jgi:hypothetical protein
MSHPYQEISKEDQIKILAQLSIEHSNDPVRALNKFKGMLEPDHKHAKNIGQSNMSLHDFIGTIKPHYQGHKIQETVHKITDQHINLGDF